MSKRAFCFYLAFGWIFEFLCLEIMFLPIHTDRMAKRTAAKANIAVLVKALESYKNDVGEIPSSLHGLEALHRNPGVKGWAGPYLRQSVPSDPWGRPHIYRILGPNTVEIVSLGKDGKVGGDGQNRDVSSLSLDEPAPSSTEGEAERLAGRFVVPLCFFGYPFIPWAIRRFTPRKNLPLVAAAKM